MENCKEDHILIDVGISQVMIDGKNSIVGDIASGVLQSFNNISITPVPKGVGTITIAVLFRHLLSSFIKRHS